MGAAVLLLDDDVYVATALQRRLRGQADVHAYSILEAELIFSNHRWDLVLADVRLPEGDHAGLNFAKHIRLSDRDLPILLITSYPDDHVRDTAFELGAWLAAKPINEQALFERVAQAYRIRTTFDAR